MQEGEPEGRLDGRRTEVRLDPFEDGHEPGELPRRVQVEDVLDERFAALEDREAIADEALCLGRVVAQVVPGQGEIGGLGRRLPMLAAAALVAAERAAVVADGRPGRLVA